MIETCHRLARSKMPLTQRAKAIIHWGHVIADKTMKLYQRKSVYWDMTMWQKLIRSRLSDDGTSCNVSIEDHDLIGMATKLDLLKQTESRLGAQLVELKARKKQLDDERKTITTKLSNINAARSLQAGPASGIRHKITENPIYVSLKSYVNWLTLPLRTFSDEERRFQENYKESIKKTQSTLSYCRNLALADLDRNPSKAQNPEELAKLKEELTHIDRLHANMELSIDRIFRQKIPQPRPVIKKEGSRGTTDFDAIQQGH